MYLLPKWHLATAKSTAFLRSYVKVEVTVKRSGSGRESAIRALAPRVEVTAIRDVTHSTQQVLILKTSHIILTITLLCLRVN